MVEPLDNIYNLIEFNKDPDCLVCGSHPQVTELIDYEQEAIRNIGKSTASIKES